MRKFLTFIAILGAVMALMDRVHIPPNIAKADTVKGVSIVKETSKKTETPKTEAASYNVPPPPKYTIDGGCGQYRALLGKYNWDARIMFAVMEAESSCVSTKVGDTWPIGGVLAPSCGLLQVRTIAAWRGTCEELKDPEFNIDKAYRVYQGQGYGAWSVYSSGKYLYYIR